MAVVTKLIYKEPGGLRPQSETEATYCFTPEGDLRIVSAGSMGRQDKGKPSQILHFPPEIQKQLFEILKNRGIR